MKHLAPYENALNRYHNKNENYYSFRAQNYKFAFSSKDEFALAIGAVTKDVNLVNAALICGVDVMAESMQDGKLLDIVLPFTSGTIATKLLAESEAVVQLECIRSVIAKGNFEVIEAILSNSSHTGIAQIHFQDILQKNMPNLVSYKAAKMFYDILDKKIEPCTDMHQWQKEVHATDVKLNELKQTLSKKINSLYKAACWDLLPYIAIPTITILAISPTLLFSSMVLSVTAGIAYLSEYSPKQMMADFKTIMDNRFVEKIKSNVGSFLDGDENVQQVR